MSPKPADASSAPSPRWSSRRAAALAPGGTCRSSTQLIGGKTVLRRTLEALLSHRGDRRRAGGDRRRTTTRSTTMPSAACRELLPPVAGGATRQESVRNGLEALAARAPDLVLVHDAARPFVTRATIGRVIDGLRRDAWRDPGPRRHRDGEADRERTRSSATVPREALATAQTPQGFPFAPLLAAHRRRREAGRDDLTDDAAVAALAGLPVRAVDGRRGNIKLTNAGGFRRRRSACSRWRSETRTGQGFDVHAFGPGEFSLALRRRDPARPGPRRPFRCRRRAARADRRAARRDRRRRHRRALSALRPAMEGRLLRPVPRRRRAARARTRRADRQSRRDARLRGAEDLAAPRRDARAHRRDRRDRRRPRRRQGDDQREMGFTGRGEGIAALAIATVAPAAPSA